MSQKNDTFNAKVEIVTYPDSIRLYSQEREDYTELALTAIKQKPSVIRYISPSYKDYSMLCDEAVSLDYNVFLLVKDSASNYKQLGIKAILQYPFLVADLAKELEHYLFFWELAISTCYKILSSIDEEKQELFPLVEKAIEEEPLAISYVSNELSIYNKLCNMAYSKNKDSATHIDINNVDKDLAMEIIRNNPEIIKYLNSQKDYYDEACKLALSINGQLIKSIYVPVSVDKLDYVFELINIAQATAPEIADYPLVLYASILDNRRKKEELLCTPNAVDNNAIKLLDNEHAALSEAYKEAILAEMHEKAPVDYNSTSDCPIKL